MLDNFATRLKHSCETPGVVVSNYLVQDASNKNLEGDSSRDFARKDQIVALTHDRNVILLDWRRSWQI